LVRLRGGRVVTPSGVFDVGAVAIDHDGRIVEVAAGAGAAGPDDVECTGCWVLPGFIDTHIHGAHGVDALDGGDAVARVAATLPRFGVTGFLPTSVACPPDVLSRFLTAVDGASGTPMPASARVLGAHLESNFINPEYKGAQPAGCLRLPPRPGDALLLDGVFTGAAIRAAIDRHAGAVRIVTLAPELPGALDLVRDLAASGHRVSVGHSAATYEEGLEAVRAGACHATHLFNRMPPMHHRAPGLAGAVLDAGPEVTCEIVGDGYHVHPALVRTAVRAKGPGGVVAITDATAGAGLGVGATARLGEHTIRVAQGRAELSDGTLAGSVTTMDAVFRLLAGLCGIPDASRMTSTTPAAALGRPDLGRIEPGAWADLVVLDQALHVRQTWVGGRLAWNSDGARAVSPGGVEP
jgi:N-acetylglucosamine-6-phosphate deacetylase